MKWTFQYRSPPKGDNVNGSWAWHTSVKHFDTEENAWAAACLLGSVGTKTGAPFEIRATPIPPTDDESEAET